MRFLKPLSVVMLLLSAPMALGDLTRMTLQPIGSPRFTNSITQSVFATGGARYVGMHVVTGDGHIQSVDKSFVPSSAAYAGDKLTDGWWVLGQSGAFTATFETSGSTGKPSDYAGLKIQIAMADAGFNMTDAVTLCYTGGEAPGLNWSKWGNGWFAATEHTGYCGTKLYGKPVETAVVVPAPGAIVLAAIGLGLCGFRRVREN
jgi:hypothetical protein